MKRREGVVEVVRCRRFRTIDSSNPELRTMQMMERETDDDDYSLLLQMAFRVSGERY